MAVNKVIYYGEVLVDMSTVTVKPETLGKGETALDASGEMITGTAEIGGEPKLQAKSVTPKTSAQTVKPDSGYDGLSQVTVNAMPTATQATPSISVDSAGKITASATQSAGYVAAGTKSATKQLTTQGAQTITPGTADKTIASGRYLTGTQTIKGDPNLVAGNIKSGVSIFGVAGSYEGSGSPGGGSVETCSIRLICNTSDVYGYSYLAYRDGQFVPVFVTYYQNGAQSKIDVTLPDVICGGYIYVTVSIMYAFLDTSINGEATTQKEYLTSAVQPVLLVHAPSTAGSTSTVTIIDND